ncbi:hypothetical protein BCR33DRAFT_720818 [Rhizoclosmatium globosum]|uniref:EF-hand domain-containing protein n=1 Tax=Rhizoclosmatium globosum TaxID=329046 RepID=A0A1Y2BUM1_9FUNG|nr:hypothetical protein BCR33DRAFT_720818 [Rhizoclosmatium globosum]|eukprot:ORY38446.1 hypothetical protein BCR33DRAFT_720818 [Rhizoclosmatium globosum]
MVADPIHALVDLYRHGNLDNVELISYSEIPYPMRSADGLTFSKGVRECFKQVFNEHDKDKDGVWSLFEMEAFFKTKVTEIMLEYMKQKGFEFNVDGQLTFAGFLGISFQTLIDKGTDTVINELLEFGFTPDTNAQDYKEAVQKVFNLFDDNMDGFLTVEDFQKVLIVLEGQTESIGATIAFKKATEEKSLMSLDMFFKALNFDWVNSWRMLNILGHNVPFHWVKYQKPQIDFGSDQFDLPQTEANPEIEIFTADTKEAYVLIVKLPTTQKPTILKNPKTRTVSILAESLKKEWVVPETGVFEDMNIKKGTDREIVITVPKNEHIEVVELEWSD